MFREDYVRDSKFFDKPEEYKSDLYQDLENSKVKLNSLYENLNFVNR